MNLKPVRGHRAPPRGRWAGPRKRPPKRRPPCLPRQGRGSGLQLVQVFDGALGVGGGRNDGALVVLQDLDPLGDTGGVVLARLKVEAKVRGEEGRPEFRDQFLPAVPFITPPLAAKAAIEPRRMASPMDSFVPEGRI